MDIERFSCSTRTSMKYVQVINLKMPTCVGILKFIPSTNSRPAGKLAFQWLEDRDVTVVHCRSEEILY